MRIPKDVDLYTVANLSVQFQRPWAEMLEAIDLLGFEPSLRLNDVSYYCLDHDRIVLLREYFAGRDATTALPSNRRSEWTPNISKH